MTTPPTTAPTGRGAVARSALERTAEQLWAEEGLAAVSLRRITEASGHRNKSALQYHFHGRDDLVLSIVAGHAARIGQRRAALLARHVGPLGLRERMEVVVVPVVEHLAALGVPSWCARFTAQVLTDPELRTEALARLLPPKPHPLPDELRAGADPELVARTTTMLRAVCVETAAEVEGELAARGASDAEAVAAWRRLGEQLVTGMTGLAGALLAP